MPSFHNVFSWSECVHEDHYQKFNDCELLKSVGIFEEGTSFNTVAFDTETLTLYFYLGRDQTLHLVMTRRFVLE